MKTALTPFLLNFLIEQGYQYLLSRTENIEHPDASVQITLTPVIARPQLRRLPRDYDTYFKLNREPQVMAKGIDDTLILLNLNADDVAKLKHVVLNKYNEETRLYA